MPRIFKHSEYPNLDQNQIGRTARQKGGRRCGLKWSDLREGWSVPRSEISKQVQPTGCFDLNQAAPAKQNRCFIGLATAAALGLMLLIGQAGAAPMNGLTAVANQVAGNIQLVRWVCGPYRCWWSPGPYYRYYDYYGPSYGYYAAPYYGYYAYAGPGWGYDWRRWWR